MLLGCPGKGLLILLGSMVIGSMGYFTYLYMGCIGIITHLLTNPLRTSWTSSRSLVMKHTKLLPSFKGIEFIAKRTFRMNQSVCRKVMSDLVCRTLLHCSLAELFFYWIIRWLNLFLQLNCSFTELFLSFNCFFSVLENSLHLKFLNWISFD